MKLTAVLALLLTLLVGVVGRPQTAAGSTPQTRLAEGLIAHWKMDEGSTTAVSP